jgi:hypothetical protein
MSFILHDRQISPRDRIRGFKGIYSHLDQVSVPVLAYGEDGKPVNVVNSVFSLLKEKLLV